MRLTLRDERLLAKLVAARWFTTSQIRRLFFAAASISAVRRRLRKLGAASYLRSHQEHQMAEAIYTIGPTGRLALEHKGMEFELEQRPPKQLEHFIGVNHIRCGVETSGVRVIYFFAFWELPKLGWAYQLIPDAVFAVDDGKPRTFIAEYDRSNEPVELLAKKVYLYQDGLHGFLFNSVLIVTKTQGRIVTLSRHLQKRGLPPRRYLAITLAEILDGGIWSKAFFDLADPEARGKRFLLKDLGSTRCLGQMFCRGDSFQ